MNETMEQWRVWLNEANFDVQRAVRDASQGDHGAMDILARMALRGQGEAVMGFLKAYSHDHINHPSAIKTLAQLYEKGDDFARELVKDTLSQENVPSGTSDILFNSVVREMEDTGMYLDIWKLNLPKIKPVLDQVMTEMTRHAHQLMSNRVFEGDVDLEGYRYMLQMSIPLPEAEFYDDEEREEDLDIVFSLLVEDDDPNLRAYFSSVHASPHGVIYDTVSDILTNVFGGDEDFHFFTKIDLASLKQEVADLHDDLVTFGKMMHQFEQGFAENNWY